MLVSEVMLQQTQASRVAEVYPRFLERFPTAGALADAGTADVLRAWGTLGYNRRAVSLWRSCRAVVETGFPRTVEALEQLPGVGPYTARAVASFAFGSDAGVVDTNVRRVLTRLDGLAPRADVQALADELVPKGRAAAWNQAMIDLGALVCRARSPGCEICPLRDGCSYAEGRRVTVTRRPTPAFETTSRYVRGRIVAELRGVKRPLSIASLRERVGVVSVRFERALAGLEREGLVTVRGRSAALGQSHAPS